MPTESEIWDALEELRDWSVTRFSMHRRNEIADIIYSLWTGKDAE